MTISNQLQTDITIKKIPSYRTIKGKCGLGWDLTRVDTQKLCQAYAKLAVYVNAFEQGRIPPNHCTDKNTFAEGYAHHNSKFHMTQIREELKERGAFDGLTIWDETKRKEG